MTTKEAIETIRIAIAEVEWEYPMNYAAAFEMAIEALEKSTQWISVKDRLPTDRKDVFIAYRFGDDKSVFFGTSNYIYPDKDPHFRSEGFCKMKVDWWMPIPKTPEEKEETHE
jgi:hypothetical protein